MRPPPSAPIAPRRVLLGPADIEDHELSAFVAAGLGVRRATVLTSSVEVFPYDRPTITTAGRYLVRGSARTGIGEVRAFSFFVEVIQSYQRSPLRFAVPARLRDRLPGGLTIPRAAAVRDLDEDSAALPY